MPDLDFKVLGVEAAERGLVPLLHFSIEIVNKAPAEKIQSVMLHAQIQIQSPRRAYTASEKEKLRDLFGRPENWGQTLRNRLWAHANAIASGFTDRTQLVLSVPCTLDLNVAATKYFYALEDGEVPLLFLFSGTIFYCGSDDRLQIERISWEKEAEYRMPVKAWREMMEHHYPNSAFVWLERDMFNRLYEFKRQHGFATWEQAIERLLEANDETRNSKSETISNDGGTIDADEEAFWAESAPKVKEEPSKRVFDLEEQTARFGEAIIKFAKKIPKGPLSDRLIAQLVGCGTTVGANYCEADDAVSRKEFFLRAGTCRKESREAKHFLRMLVCAYPEMKDEARPLWREAKELNLIFGKIGRGKDRPATPE